MNVQMAKLFSLLALVLGMVGQRPAAANGLDQNCVVNILNRTVQVGKDGGWSMPNVPSQMGRVRARATCTILGDTFSGESDYFNVVQNGIANVPEIKFENIEPIPVSLKVTEPTVETLSSQGATAQLKVAATYRDGTVKDVTGSANGANYTSSNPAIVSVSGDGLITALSSGSVLITVRKDEVVAFKDISVSISGDADQDGLPDDFELTNSLDPNDPLDAAEDPDNDGLTTEQEYQVGTNFKVADSDGDGLNDGVEVSGSKGYVTDPLKADSDGDGVNDNDEILAGFNPTDNTDGGGRSFVELIVTPANPAMTFNTVYNEAVLQVKVTGKRGNGTLEDLTAKSTGTGYSSSNLAVVSFGAKDGLLFAGQSGTANLTVRNGGLEKTVTVTVGSYSPTALSSIAIPGYANNVDVAGDFAYIAAGTAGLQVVDVSNHNTPRIVGNYDTEGVAIDVQIVGNTVYLADGDRGVKLFDVTRPTAPVLVATYDTAGVAQDLRVDGPYLYIAEGLGGLEIVDVRQPSHPKYLGYLQSLGDVKGVDAEGNRAVVVAGSALHLLDVTDKANPVQKSALNVGPVKDVVLQGNYAYVAAYTSGYQVVDVSVMSQPSLKVKDMSFYPFDLEMTDGFAFFAEVRFVNAAPYVNTEEPGAAVFQGILDFKSFNDYNGTGIAVDANYVYLTASTAITDYASTGVSNLLIGQYRLNEDRGGVAPTVIITEPADDVTVEVGNSLAIHVEAEDDIGVASVDFLIDDQIRFSDTTRPYQFLFEIPFASAGEVLEVSAQANDFAGNAARAAPGIFATVIGPSDDPSATYTLLTLPLLNSNLMQGWLNGGNYSWLFPGLHRWKGIPFKFVSNEQGANVFLGTTEIPSDVFGATALYTVINTAWGISGADNGDIEVFGSAGAYAKFDLIQGLNVRDHYHGTLNNVIDDRFAHLAFYGEGNVRLDMQRFKLPDAFKTQTLTKIKFTGNYFGCCSGSPFLAAMTVESK